MVATSTWTRPFLSCQTSPVPIGEPPTLYITTCARETALPIRCIDAHAPIASVAAAASGRTAKRSVILDSCFEITRAELRTDSPLLVANLELRPENNRGTVLHTTRVLCRRARAGVNLDRHNFVRSEERRVGKERRHGR